MGKHTSSHGLFLIRVKVVHRSEPPYHTYSLHVRANAGTEDSPKWLLSRFCRTASEAFADLANQYEADAAPSNERTDPPSRS